MGEEAAHVHYSLPPRLVEVLPEQDVLLKSLVQNPGLLCHIRHAAADGDAAGATLHLAQQSTDETCRTNRTTSRLVVLLQCQILYHNCMKSIGLDHKRLCDSASEDAIGC